MIEDNLDEEDLDREADLANQLDEEGIDIDFASKSRFQYVPEDPRAIPCSPTDVEAINRVLNEQYFGGNYSR